MSHPTARADTPTRTHNRSMAAHRQPCFKLLAIGSGHLELAPHPICPSGRICHSLLVALALFTIATRLSPSSHCRLAAGSLPPLCRPLASRAQRHGRQLFVGPLCHRKQAASGGGGGKEQLVAAVVKSGMRATGGRQLNGATRGQMTKCHPLRIGPVWLA